MIRFVLKDINQSRLIRYSWLTCFLLQSSSCNLPALADSMIFKPVATGSMGMEEATSQKDANLTWKILLRAFERVQKGRLDEADRWLMYALLNASPDPLFQSRESIQYLAEGLFVAQSAKDPDVMVLQALIQSRLNSPRLVLETLRAVEASYPNYHSMNQVKSRIRALDLMLNPPRQLASPEAEPLSPKEIQEVLERIARQKIALSADQKTLEQALAEAKEEQLEYFSRWPLSRFPLKVFIPSDLACAKIPGYMAGDRTALINAFQLWQSVTKGRLKFVFADSAAKADITCEWFDHPDKLGAKAKDAIGTCGATCDDSGIIHHARLRILTVSDKNAAPNGAGFRSKYLRNVALHEIGHALGLQHVDSPKAIMFFQLHNPLLEALAPVDIAAMEKMLFVSQKEVDLNAKRAGIQADEAKIRFQVTNINSQIAAAKDVERMHLWEQAFLFYNDAFHFRPTDEELRQSICRTSVGAGRIALKKSRVADAIKYLSRGRELMNKQTPIELRQVLLESLRGAFESDGQNEKAAEVQTVLQGGAY